MEKQRMKKKGFTLVELLVVISIIAMLLAILMPALGKVRQLAQRLICGTNLAGIGKAMMVYTNDDEYESYPIAGPAGTEWDNSEGTATQPGGVCSWDWKLPDIPGSTLNPVSGTATSTLSASLYLLVKYADVSPAQFICSGSNEKKFELSQYTNLPTSPSPTIEDVWDFGAVKDEKTVGSHGTGHNSYSYQLPMPVYNGTVTIAYPVSTTSNPSEAVMADRNPWWEKGRKNDVDFYTWDTTTKKIDPLTYPVGNATSHQKDGQNVLYADSHVKFEKSANCGIEQDNIYTTWGVSPLPTTSDGQPGSGADATRQVGGTTKILPGATGYETCPQNEDDNYLVNDYN